MLNRQYCRTHFLFLMVTYSKASLLSNRNFSQSIMDDKESINVCSKIIQQPYFLYEIDANTFLNALIQQ